MKRIMIDRDKCTGCKNCAAACMQAHRNNTGDIYSLCLSDLNNESRNHIMIGKAEQVVPLFCRHCNEPKCVMACMSGALSKNEVSGLVLYDEKKCAACFMCVMNCPFGLLKPDRLTKRRVIKCDFCVDDEEGPNCVRMCPSKAISIEEVTSL